MALFKPPPASALVPNERITFWPDLIRPHLPSQKVYDCSCHHGTADSPFVEMGLSVGELGPAAIQTGGCPARSSLNQRRHYCLAKPILSRPPPLRTKTPNCGSQTPTQPLVLSTIRIPTDPNFDTVLTRLVNRLIGLANVGFADARAEADRAGRMGFHAPTAHPTSLWDCH